MRARSPETQALINRLRRLAPDERVTFSQLSAELGFDVGGMLPKLDSARRVLLNEQHAKIERHGSEVWRISDLDAVNKKAPYFRRKASRAALRGAHTLHSVDYQALPESEQKAHNIGLAMFGAVRAATSAATVRKLSKGPEIKKLKE